MATYTIDAWIYICRLRMRAAFFTSIFAPQIGKGFMIVTFCGHREISLSDDEKILLKKELKKVLKESPDAVFYLGDYGSFDRICNITLKELQKDYPRLRRVFITPYLDPEYSHLKNADYYDEVLYPFVDKVIKRYAISLRNKWMVDRADYLIAYVMYDWGGAAKTLEYAVRRRIPYVNLGAKH